MRTSILILVLGLVLAACGVPAESGAGTGDYATTAPPPATAPGTPATTAGTTQTPPIADAVDLAGYGTAQSLTAVSRLAIPESKELAIPESNLTIRWSLDAPGNYHTLYDRNDGRTCETAYEAATLRFVSWCSATSATEPAVGVHATGLPTAGLEARERDLLYTGLDTPYPGNYARAVAYFEGHSTGEASVMREIHGEDGTTAIDVKADITTGLPLAVTWSSEAEIGTTQQTWTLESIEFRQGPLDVTDDMARLWDEKADWIELDYGFRRVTVEQLQQLLPYKPIFADSLPGGLELADVLYAETTIVPSGPVPSEHVAVFVYRRGLEQVTITNRYARAQITKNGQNGTYEGPAGPDDWADPLSFFDETDGRVEIAGTSSPFAPLSADFTIPVHTWGIIGDAVVTIQGNVSPDSLIAATRSLVAPGG